MKRITLSFNLTDDLGLKSIEFNYNDSGLDSDSKLLQKLSMSTLKSIHKNKDSCAVQDLLNEFDIETSND